MISKIAERLGIPESNARILYDQWLDQASSTLSAGHPLVLKGLGTFTYANETLSFTADPDLELLGNRVYAGLEALTSDELSPSPVQMESDLDDPFAEIINPKKAEPGLKSKPVFAFDPDAVAPAPEPAPEPKIVIVDESVEDDVVVAAPAVPPAKPSYLTAWLAAAAAAMVLIVAGWYGIQWYTQTLEDEMAAAPVPSAEQTPAAPVAEASPVATPEFGLRGPLNPLEGRVYGIIVHSLPAKTDSESQCLKISSAGLRCSVVEAERNGVPTWRVAIGQFASIADAQNAVSELPAEYSAPDKHFIARIQ